MQTPEPLGEESASLPQATWQMLSRNVTGSKEQRGGHEGGSAPSFILPRRGGGQGTEPSPSVLSEGGSIQSPKWSGGQFRDSAAAPCLKRDGVL